MSNVHELLKELRVTRNLSLRSAAKKSGLSHSYIDSLEKGYHPKTKAPIKPSPDSLKALAAAYDYSYKELMDIAGYLDDDSMVFEDDHTEEYPIAEEKVGLSKEATEYVLRELVKKYNIDLTDPRTAENLEDMIKIVHRNSQKD